MVLVFTDFKFFRKVTPANSEGKLDYKFNRINRIDTWTLRRSPEVTWLGLLWIVGEIRSKKYVPRISKLSLSFSFCTSSLPSILFLSFSETRSQFVPTCLYVQHLQAQMFCCSTSISSNFFNWAPFIALSWDHFYNIRFMLNAKKSSINLLAPKLLIKWWWNWLQKKKNRLTS